MPATYDQKAKRQEEEDYRQIRLNENLIHVIPAFSFFAGDEACTRRSSSSSSSRPRIAAPADRSIASAVLTAGGGTARLLAEAGSCLASSFAGAEAEATGSELSTQG